MTDKLKPCPFCEGDWPVSPRFCDAPYMDVEAYALSVVSFNRNGNKVSFTDLVIGNRHGYEARFRINYCPFCGRKLVSDETD